MTSVQNQSQYSRSRNRYYGGEASIGAETERPRWRCWDDCSCWRLLRGRERWERQPQSRRRCWWWRRGTRERYHARTQGARDDPANLSTGSGARGLQQTISEGASWTSLASEYRESIPSDWVKGSATQSVALRFLPEILSSLMTSFETIMFFLMAWGWFSNPLPPI